MNPMNFIKKDLAKLGDNKKIFKTIGIIGGLGLAAINMINDKNDRESMKDEITQELLKKLTSGKEE